MTSPHLDLTMRFDTRYPSISLVDLACRVCRGKTSPRAAAVSVALLCWSGKVPVSCSADRILAPAPTRLPRIESMNPPRVYGKVRFSRRETAVILACEASRRLGLGMADVGASLTIVEEGGRWLGFDIEITDPVETESEPP